MTSAGAKPADLPLAIQPEQTGGRSLAHLRDWLRARRAWLRQRLIARGAVLFRGFRGLHAPADLADVATGFVDQLSDYKEGQSERRELAERVYNSTYYPADRRITLHNELSYAAAPPRWLFFACAVPAATGGDTPLLDCRAFARDLPPELDRAFRGQSVRYAKNMHGGRGLGKSWQEHYQTGDSAEVERYLRASGTGFQWTDGGGLRIWRVKPAIARHPDTGEDIWFNQAHLWHASSLGDTGRALRAMVAEDDMPTHARFADGRAIPDELMDEVRAQMWARAVHHEWRAGDILFVDNFAVAHGRNAYTGERSLFVAMAADDASECPK